MIIIDKKISMDKKTKLEIEKKYWNEFWKNSKKESPSSDILENLVAKSINIPKFYNCLKKVSNKINPSSHVLEIGAGHGWASCIFKSIYPDSYISASDISIDSLKSLKKWENIFNVKVDNYFESSSNSINAKDESLDYVFCYEAAHHFRDHYSTIKEVKRVLKKGGIAFYFNEPVCNKYIYPLAFWITNIRSSGNIDSPSPEDLIVTSEIKSICLSQNLNIRINYYLNLFGRGPISTLYYLCLNIFPFLKYFLPSCANIVISKK